MRIKMLEYFQGRDQPSLELGREYNSAEIGEELAAWLLEHRKAIQIKEPEKPKLKEPEPDVQPDPVEVQEEPAQKPVKRARRGRGREKL